MKTLAGDMHNLICDNCSVAPARLTLEAHEGGCCLRYCLNGNLKIVLGALSLHVGSEDALEQKHIPCSCGYSAGFRITEPLQMQVVDVVSCESRAKT